jgi:glutathione S-transferase
MTLALYDHPNSSNALKVRFLLSVLGLEYERRRVELVRPRAADYVALNPMGTVPLLVAGDFRLAESHAILKYLSAREGRDDLYPSDLRERARVDEFLDRWHTVLRPAFFRVESPALGHRPDSGFDPSRADPAAAARAAAEIAPQLELCDRVVGDDGFAVLGRFTIADCAVAPILFRTTKTGLDLSPYPNVLRLREAVLAHPAWPAAEPVI